MTNTRREPTINPTNHPFISRVESLIYGCMRLPINDQNAVESIIKESWQAGFRRFDHADIYGGGNCEARFGEVWHTLGLPRDKLLITSKSGIRFAGDPTASDPKRYDFSRRHIINSVNNSLKRLRTDYLDAFLLHRPDFLMRIDELAETINELTQAGKIREFGVSNFSASQIDMLAAALDQPIRSNQIEFSLLKLTPLFDGTIDYCLKRGIKIEAWSPLAGSFGKPENHQQERIHQELNTQSMKYKVPPWVVVLEWIAFHPARIKSIIGTTNLRRIAQAVVPLETVYSRSDWYRLLEASTGEPVA